MAPGALLAASLGEFVCLRHDAACYMHYTVYADAGS